MLLPGFIQARMKCPLVRATVCHSANGLFPSTSKFCRIKALGVYACWVYVCACACVCVYTYMYVETRFLGVSTNCCLCFIFFSLSLEFTDWVSLAAPEIYLFRLPHWEYRQPPPHLPFYISAGDLNLGPHVWVANSFLTEPSTQVSESRTLND